MWRAALEAAGAPETRASRVFAIDAYCLRVLWDSTIWGDKGPRFDDRYCRLSQSSATSENQGFRAPKTV